MQSIPDIATHFSTWFNIGVSAAGVITGAIAALVVNKFRAFKRAKTKKHFYDGLFVDEEFHRTQINIHEKIAIYRSEVHADRVTIAQFHNGGEFLDGTPMKKFSVTYETVTPSTSLEGSKTQNILLSIMWTIVQHITSGKIYFGSINDCAPGTYLQSWLNSRGTKFYSFSPIKKGDNYQGFLFVEWLHDAHLDASVFEEKTQHLVSQIQIELFMKESE